MNFETVNPANFQTYFDLAQDYEREFSSITQKQPDAQGIYPLDTQLGGNVTGLIYLINDAPAGIAAIKETDHHSYEMCEFYVVPRFRHQRNGCHFAHAIWQHFPGSWEIKQIAGADAAIHFWRRTLSDFEITQFVEDIYDDPYWGKVTRQRFSCSSLLHVDSSTH